jgi:predicted phage baseplate assembly protein
LPLTKAEFDVFPAPDEDLKGTGNRPPVLDDATEAKLVCWVRAYRHDGSHFGKVRAVVANAAETWQARKALPEFLGTGTAQANQIYKLGNRPVLDHTVVLEVEENGAWRRWTETDSFHASTSDNRHFTVDRESGDVRFGTVVQGMAPQIGQRIRVLEYRYGGGAAGNVAAKAISGNIPAVSVNVLLGNVPVQVKVVNPQPAFGGGETETIEAALERIPGELRRRDRAVTSGDFQELALETPGANVGRAECLARFYPPTRTPERAGVVSVVVWPKDDKKHPNAPVPDENLRRAVCEWLDQRRLVTTELYVIPPTYRKVAITVGLRVKPGYGVEAVRRWVELVLRQYLAPLPPFGPDGGGWPLGRRVYGPELEAAALQVEGVEFLETLKVAAWDEKTSAWVQGPVELAIYEVPEVASISVVEGPAQDPPGTITAPPTGLVAVPIPIVRQVC